jgi:hypothetical protein
MKKTTRKLALTTTTVRALKDLAAVSGGSGTCLVSHACYTKPAGGCP